MENSIIKNYRMRRNGGEVNRASETSDLAYSENQIRTMGNMGMVDSGMNYGTPPANTGKPKYDEFGTKIPENFESSTGQDYEITAGKGTLEGRQTLRGPRGRNQSPTVTQGDGKKPLETKKAGITSTSSDENTTTRTTYGKTTRSQTPNTLYGDFKSGKKYDTTTDYKIEKLKIKPYNA